MKCCLSYNQAPHYLQKADEIKFPWGKRDLLKDYSETYPDKTFILQHIFPAKQFDINEIFEIFDEIDNTLILCVGNVEDCYSAAENDIPYYYAFPVATYQEFNGLKILNPEYIIPGAPLFFNMPFLKDSEVPIRVFPNIGNLTDFPQQEPAHGTWIRPEDLEFYGQFIDAYEFTNVTISQEAALFRIYHEQKQLIGPLGLIIDSIKWDYAGHSDLIQEDLVSHRIQCKQKCESKETNCHLCETALHLANPKRLEFLLKRDSVKRK